VLWSPEVGLRPLVCQFSVFSFQTELPACDKLKCRTTSDDLSGDCLDD